MRLVRSSPFMCMMGPARAEACCISARCLCCTSASICPLVQYTARMRVRVLRVFGNVHGAALSLHQNNCAGSMSPTCLCMVMRVLPLDGCRCRLSSDCMEAAIVSMWQSCTVHGCSGRRRAEHSNPVHRCHYKLLRQLARVARAPRRCYLIDSREQPCQPIT